MSNENAVVYDRQALLRDGTPVRIRAVRADDDRRLVAAFGKLEPESVYTRFFSFKDRLTPADLERLHAVDGRRGAAIVVTLAADEDTLIAGASYTVHPGPDGLPSAEVAFTTEEDYQGKGIARLLLEALAGIARAHGITRLDAEVLAENRAMLRVFERSRARPSAAVAELIDTTRKRRPCRQQPTSPKSAASSTRSTATRRSCSGSSWCCHSPAR
jgi:GNAT superfamily N-acetyltransferase